jgi:hypothetical protein
MMNEVSEDSNFSEISFFGMKLRGKAEMKIIRAQEGNFWHKNSIFLSLRIGRQKCSHRNISQNTSRLQPSAINFNIVLFDFEGNIF